MSFDQIVAEARSLSPEERKALIGQLLAQGRGERDAEFRRMLSRKIDDHDPSHWGLLEDMAKHLQLDTGVE